MPDGSRLFFFAIAEQNLLPLRTGGSCGGMFWRYPTMCGLPVPATGIARLLLRSVPALLHRRVRRGVRLRAVDAGGGGATPPLFHLFTGKIFNTAYYVDGFYLLCFLHMQINVLRGRCGRNCTSAAGTLFRQRHSALAGRTTLLCLL